MGSVAGNRQRLHAHERTTAATLAAAYGTHTAVREWVRRIPDTADVTDPNLTSAVFAFRTGLIGFAFTGQDVITQAAQVARDQGQADALALVDDLTGDSPSMQDSTDDGTGANPLDQLALDAPHRLAAALMARLGGGGLLTAAADVIAGTLAKALLENRQAIIDAYRQAQADVFKTAEDVSGWVWTSQLSVNTCGFCYAMHGTWHPDTEEMATHPFCQCMAEPSTLTAAEYAATGPELGADLFAELSNAEQRQILGPARHAMYERGLPLAAMTGQGSLLPLRELDRRLPRRRAA